MSENIPHRLVPDKFEIVGIQEYVDEGKEAMNIVNYSVGYKTIQKVFSDNDDYSITNDHKRIVDEWWGLSEKSLSRKYKK